MQGLVIPGQIATKRAAFVTFFNFDLCDLEHWVKSKIRDLFHVLSLDVHCTCNTNLALILVTLKTGSASNVFYKDLWPRGICV